MNIFDLPGKDFLGMYLALLAGGVIVAVLVRWLLRGPAALAEPPRLTPYEIAYLSGGRKLATDAAIAALVQQKVLQTDTAANKIVAPAGGPSPADPLEQAVYRAASGRADGATVREIRKEAGSAVLTLEDRLTRLGLIAAPGRRILARALPFGIVIAIGLVGLQKMLIGMDRGKLVTFLVLLLTLTLIIGIGFLAKGVTRTRAGDHELRRLRAEHQALRTTAEANPEALGQTDLMLAMCLFGATIISLGPLADLRRMMQPPSQGGSGCGGAACGATGCGGGGDGGAGCGGGGCGGCGGGGGD